MSICLSRIKSCRFLFILLALWPGTTSFAQTASARRFEQLWGDFDKHYAYFAQKGVDWDSIRQVYAPKFGRKLSAEKEARLLGQVILSLRDGHVSLETTRGVYRYRSPGPPETEDTRADSIFTDTLFAEGSCHFAASRDSLLLLRLGDLEYPINTLFLRDVFRKPWRGLIVDLRNNPGGNEAYARMIVEHLIAQEMPYKHVRFTAGTGRNHFQDWQTASIRPRGETPPDMPVAVLIDEGCVSSCEAMVLMLRCLDHSTLIGRTTGGSSGNPRRFTLDNGWTYAISAWQEEDMAYTLIEDNGISPDVSTNREDPLPVAIALLRKLHAGNP
jgi:hypothetical protein